MYILQILQYTTKKLIILRENKILLDRRFVVHRRFVVQVPVIGFNTNFWIVSRVDQLKQL